MTNLKTINLRRVVASLAMFSILFMSQVAHAKSGFRFGDSESLHKLQDIDMPGPKGEKLYLANRTISKFIFLGVYLSDKGYVLAVVDDPKKGYYPLEEELIKKLQNAQQLPKPLPKYTISLWDYFLGYSLWIVIFIIVVWTFVQTRVSKKLTEKSND